jgi:hypothetical protein
MSVKAAYDGLLAVIRWIDTHGHAADYPLEPGPMTAGGCLHMAIEPQVG